MFTFPFTQFTTSTGGSIIKSIQQISISIASASTSNTATITSVNTAKTVVLYRGFTSDDTTAAWGGFKSGINPRFTLTNSTTVTATKGNTGTGATTVYLTVVEFSSSAVTSIQRGTIALTSATSNTATITSVTTANCVCFWEGVSAVSGGDDESYNAYVSLTNSTTVTANRLSNSANTSTVGYCVVQFASSTINSIQQNIVSVSGTANKNVTISSVDTSKTIIIYGGYSTDNATVRNDLMEFYLSNSTTINLNNNGGANTANNTYVVTALEFKSGVVNSLQTGNISISASTTGTATITSVNTAKSISNFNSFTVPGSNNPNIACVAISLASSTTSTMFINTSTGTGPSTRYEVIEFV